MLDLSDDQRVGAFDDLRKPLPNIDEEQEVGGHRVTQESFMDNAMTPQPEKTLPQPDRLKTLFSSAWSKK